MKNQSIFYAVLFFAILFSSCSKDEEPKGKVGSNQIYVSQVQSHSANVQFRDATNQETHTIVVTKKESGEVVFSGEANATDSIENLEANSVYIISIEVLGYEQTPYDVVEIKTKLIDDIVSTNLEDDNEAELGYEVKLTTTMTNDDTIDNLKFYLVNIDDAPEKVEIVMIKNNSVLSFVVPENLLPLESQLTHKEFKIQYGTADNNLENLAALDRNSRLNDYTIKIYYPEITIFSKGSERNIFCEFKTGYYISLGGLYPSLYEGKHDESKANLYLKNLDNGKELFFMGIDYSNTACHVFQRRLFTDYTGYNGMNYGTLNIRFLKDEEQGIVAGNYSAKVTYELADGFHESNTFEFVIEN